MWMPEEGFKDFKTLLIYQFIIHICVYLGRGSVMCPQFTCGHIKLYMKCVLQVRLSISSCEMWTTHLEFVWEFTPVSKNKWIWAKEVEPFNINKYVCEVMRLCESESELCVMWGSEPGSKTDVGVSHLGAVWHLGVLYRMGRWAYRNTRLQIQFFFLPYCDRCMFSECTNQIHIWSQSRCTSSSHAVMIGICADDLASSS